MTHKERMLAELPYLPNMDGLEEERLACRKKIYEFNNLPPDETGRMSQILKDLFGKTGEKITINSPFQCDYGRNIEVGDNFFANYNLVILDVGKVTVGKNALFGPNVSIFTAAHPIHPDTRNTGYECGIPVKIGDNVWIGGNSVILPGVTIGDNVVIGAGSVVTHDVPDNMIVVGNPCRILREISEEDRRCYFRKRRFDIKI